MHSPAPHGPQTEWAAALRDPGHCGSGQDKEEMGHFALHN